MKITISYDSSWRNSFLDGDNNEPIPKQGRKHIASMSSLGNKDNFKKRSITNDTVMGVLNRLIGDQRKLYQSRKSQNYYFLDIEKNISYKDYSIETQDMTYLRNIASGIQTDPSSFAGSITMDGAIFTSDYSCELWGVLDLDFEQLCDFIVFNNKIISKKKFDPLVVADFFDSFKQKPLKNEGLVGEAVKKLHEHFNEEVNYKNKQGDIVPINLYCSALYLQLDRLSSKYDMDSAKTKSGKISGISKRLFTKKDFMDKCSTGGKKIIFGNPYIHEAYVKGEGKTRNLLTKASGKLDIILNISESKAIELRTMIYNAGVSSFYLGKKGLAFVDGKISVSEEQ